MAYVILSVNGAEIDRRPLRERVVIGRAPDCDIHIRDILLSRRHCRIEPIRGGWLIADLESKNGTLLGATPLRQHLLRDGDQLQIGRTTLTFRAGEFVPASPGTRCAQPFTRPTDPAEALAGTVGGFELVEPGQVERTEGMPVPQPRPLAPSSYQTEDVYGMVAEIVSSSWDSIMAMNARPLVRERPPPTPGVNSPAQVTSRQRVAFSLQADHRSSAHDAAAPIRRALSPAPRRKMVWAAALVTLLAACAVVMLLLTRNAGVEPAVAGNIAIDANASPALLASQAVETEVAIASPLIQQPNVELFSDWKTAFRSRASRDRAAIAVRCLMIHCFICY